MSAVASSNPMRRDVGRLLGASVVAQALPFAVLPWLTRHFEPAEIGRWLLFATVASNLATVACLRYEYALVLPRHCAVARRLLDVCLWLSAAWSALVVLAVLLLVVLGRMGWSIGPFDALGICWLWLAPAVGAAGAMQALSLWQNRAGDYAGIGRARVLVASGTVLLQVASVLLPVSGDTALIGSQVLGAAIGALWLARRAAWPFGRQTLQQMRRTALVVWRHRQFPLVNAPHAFVNALQDTLALALVLAVAGPAAAGLFGLTLRAVMAPTSLIGGAWSEVLLGRTAALRREGGDLAPVVRRAIAGLAAMGAVLAVVLVLAGPALFSLAFGPEWRESGTWARWLAPYVLGRMVVGPLTVLPMVLGRQAAAFAFSVCGNALYVLAVLAGLTFGGSVAGSTAGALTWACGLVSVVMGVYFAIYGGWLWRAAQSRAAMPAAVST